MFNNIGYNKSREKNYNLVIEQLKVLSTGIDLNISVLSNASALLNCFFDDINWVGFYILDKEVLKVGPFQGLPACTNIPLTKGVCGACATSKKTQLVADVHKFPGHIACDPNSKSEIVVPIFVENQLYGLLDIDSPTLNYFDEVDQKYLEIFCHELAKYLTLTI